MLLLYGKNFIFSSFYFTCFLLEKKGETTVFKNVYMLKFMMVSVSICHFKICKK
ncbi:hypothetical protein B4088_5002 [Bacillus cereus]|uniref:Uncharacterized protein n=1 Tax=Bacillus cereus TaxID=1396 RepID=A0A164LND9_BACCE|nr:hypothetical protein B4088_5002 [Bacillus cereus]